MCLPTTLDCETLGIWVLTLTGVGGSSPSSNDDMVAVTGDLGACSTPVPGTRKGLMGAGASSKFDLADAAALDNDWIEFSADLRNWGIGIMFAVSTGEEMLLDFDGVWTIVCRSSIH